MARLYLSLVLVIAMVVLRGSASAENEKSRIVQEKAAKKACAVGDFQKGADILADLLVETNDPTHIYNQARCYQQNNRWEQAISRFREYMRKAKNLSDSDRAETEQQISDCEASLGKAAQVEPPAVAATIPVANVETRAQPLETEKSKVAAQPALRLQDGSQGRGLRRSGIVSAVVGLAAVGTGVGFALKTQSISSDEGKNGPTKAKEDQRRSLETWGWVSYGVGAVALATGSVLYILGWPSDQSTSVALLPILVPDGASMMLKGRF